MRSFRNPFRVRTSEAQHRQGAGLFLTTFGPAMLDLLPDDIWDRLFVIRSAPGGGKTSLMKLFEASTLHELHQRRDRYEEIETKLTTLEAIDGGGPRIVGARVDLRRSYKGLLDLPGGPEIAERLFLRLVNARVVVAMLEAAVDLAGLAFPHEVDRVRIEPGPAGAEALSRLGGPGGDALYSRARATEREILDLVDSLLPVTSEGISGHSELYSLVALNEAHVLVKDESLEARPLVMFDDGHDLHPSQREVLLRHLVDRSITSARWYAERFQALSTGEVIGDPGPLGRDARVLDLEATARAGHAPTAAAAGRRRSFDPLLLDIANRRARRSLHIYGEESYDFADLLDIDDYELLGDRPDDVLSTVAARVQAAAGGDRRYAAWIAHAREKRGYEAALGWRELEILIARDRDRQQGELFDVELDQDELGHRTSSSLREAAGCFLAADFGLPYYAGTTRLPRLASFNVEQFIELAGSIFEEMLALITLARHPRIAAKRQHAMIRAASDTLWREIPQRYSYGRDVQLLLAAIAQMSRRETFRPKAPYTPGVTGTALSVDDHRRLLDPEVRASLPGADALYVALGQAVGFNLLEMDRNVSVKNRHWTVLYLNRLLCARFGLPLGRGGFRERHLEELCSWMVKGYGRDHEPPPGPEEVAPQLSL